MHAALNNVLHNGIYDPVSNYGAVHDFVPWALHIVVNAWVHDSAQIIHCMMWCMIQCPNVVKDTLHAVVHDTLRHVVHDTLHNVVHDTLHNVLKETLHDVVHPSPPTNALLSDMLALNSACSDNLLFMSICTAVS